MPLAWTIAPTLIMPRMKERKKKTDDVTIAYPAKTGSLQAVKLASGMADKPIHRASLKEKLGAFKVKAAGGELYKAIQKKPKDKETIL